MLEWLVLLAGTLLFIINLSTPREHATNPPPGDQTVVLPADLVAQLAAYKTLLVASTSNPNNTGAVQATSNAKTQIDMELAQWQEDVATMQSKIQKSVDVDTGLGSDVAALHQRVASYEKTLPELQDTLTKSNVLTADKVQDTTMMVAKAVAITVIGLFAVFVSGLF
jgi:septal ring factor EnvC (AmiA/AmiB activator)